jgi:hypothetical protein
MILGISGRKQAGKNTTANILHGIVLKREGFIKDWNIGSNGELLVDSDGWGEFDITRMDSAFSQWADNNMWPFVKLYSFADSLKYICTELFDIPHKCVYGTDKQKNMPQNHLLWENMPGLPLSTGPMTAREFMQFLGTDVMRKMHQPIWVNACIKKIQREQSELAIIADVRFPNEAKAIEDAGGKVVRLTRSVHEDYHSSEVALDNYPFTDYIDNEIESIDNLMVKVKEFYRNLKESNVSNLC